MKNVKVHKQVGNTARLLCKGAEDAKSKHKKLWRDVTCKRCLRARSI